MFYFLFTGLSQYNYITNTLPYIKYIIYNISFLNNFEYKLNLYEYILYLYYLY